MIYFTADTHFNHELILKNRRLGSVEEMNELLIARWNEHVNPGDKPWSVEQIIQYLEERKVI